MSELVRRSLYGSKYKLYEILVLWFNKQMILTWLRGKKFYIKMSFMSITSNDTELSDNESNNNIISFNKWSYKSEV